MEFPRNTFILINDVVVIEISSCYTLLTTAALVSLLIYEMDHIEELKFKDK